MKRDYHRTGPFLPYDEARALVRASRVRSAKRFAKWRRPAGVPSRPQHVYRNAGWVSWGEFFGTGWARQVLRENCLPYWQARALTREAGIRTPRQFAAWKRPPGIPACPAKSYEDAGWVNWSEFLGTAWLPLETVAALARKEGIRGRMEYLAWKRPDGVPSNPEVVYRDLGWTSWGDFLGTGRGQGWWRGNFMSYKQAMERARAAGICSSRAYYLWMRPEGMPVRPDIAYRNSGWVSWPKFLGKIRKSREAVRRIRVY